MHHQINQIANDLNNTNMKELGNVWVLLIESNVDGDIIISTSICATIERAKKELADFKKSIFTDEYSRFKSDSENKTREVFEIEETETSFYINDPCDDYYHNVRIYEQDIHE